MKSSKHDNTAQSVNARELLNDTHALPPGADQTNRLLIDHLDSAVRNMDVRTSRQLASMRRDLLAQQLNKHRAGKYVIPGFQRWAPALAGIAALAIAGNLWLGTPPSPLALENTADNATTLESLPILSASDDLDFYQSVDFLVWMEKNAG